MWPCSLGCSLSRLLEHSSAQHKHGAMRAHRSAADGTCRERDRGQLHVTSTRPAAASARRSAASRGGGRDWRGRRRARRAAGARGPATRSRAAGLTAPAACRAGSRASSPRNHASSGTPNPRFGACFTFSGSRSSKASRRIDLGRVPAQSCSRRAASPRTRSARDRETARALRASWPSTCDRPSPADRRAGSCESWPPATG